MSNSDCYDPKTEYVREYERIRFGNTEHVRDYWRRPRGTYNLY